MRNIFNNLNKRERSLIVLVFLLIILCIIFIWAKSFLTSYNQSVFNLNKAKSDYSYVKDRVDLAVKKKNTQLNNPDEIKNYLISNISSLNSKLDVILSNELIEVSFYSIDIKSGIEVISQISQLLDKQPLNLSINQGPDSIYFSVSL